MVCSRLSELPERNPKSNTPALAFPYSDGKAEVKKSEFFKTFVLMALTGPPVNSENLPFSGLVEKVKSNSYTTKLIAPTYLLIQLRTVISQVILV